ncbi:MAG: glycosyltransferase family 2 protein [Lachnospiraceae bacterium]|nr:glycosyltransferase family 2 protein [Lachnospiraceae bacterium]
MPYFTICIPTYNRGYIIHRALNSIESQLFRDFEVLIIDDGSLDETDMIVRKWIEKNRGGYI